MRSFILSLAMLSATWGPAAPEANAATSNEKAAQQIAKNLKDSGKLKAYRVGVKYEDGVAWLTGTVTSEKQLQIAEQIASNTPGVSHVICKLEVASSESGSFAPAAYQQEPPAEKDPPCCPSLSPGSGATCPFPSPRPARAMCKRPLTASKHNTAPMAVTPRVVVLWAWPRRV